MTATPKAEIFAISSFISGIGTSVTPILFAPKKGSETRADLKNKLDELVDQVKKIVNDSLDKFAKQMNYRLKHA